MINRTSTLAFAVCTLAGGGAWADAGHGPGEVGTPGTEAQVDRTIEVTMGDNFYEPAAIRVAEGATIRFVISNSGQLLHEFNIGTAAMHAAHQAEMMTMMQDGMIDVFSVNHEMMGMPMGDGHAAAHDDPNSVLLEPGQAAALIWTFSNAVEIEFACNVPGHYQAGMRGSVQFGS